MNKTILLLFALSTLLAAAPAAHSAHDKPASKFNGRDGQFDIRSLNDVKDLLPTNGNDEVDIPGDASISTAVRSGNSGQRSLHRRKVTITINQGGPQQKQENYRPPSNPEPPAQCKCRPLPDNNGVCYDMYAKNIGPCTKRPCSRSYECVPGGGVGLKDCIRRFAKFEVRVIRKKKGVYKCRRVRLPYKKVFYSPYY